MRWQKSPMAKGKIEAAFSRLDRLGLGKTDGDAVDVRESIRRVDLFTSVTSAPSESGPC